MKTELTRIACKNNIFKYLFNVKPTILHLQPPKSLLQHIPIYAMSPITQHDSLCANNELVINKLHQFKKMSVFSQDKNARE